MPEIDETKPARKYDHERLEVYGVAMEFLDWRKTALRRVPRGCENLVGQLTRASTSIALNIAEGAGEFSAAERVHFFRIARRSSTECLSIMDVLDRLGLEAPQKVAEGRALLRRITAMLTRLCRPYSAPTQPHVER